MEYRGELGTKTKQQEDGENCIMRGFILMLFTKYYLGNQIGGYGQDIQHTQETTNADKILATKPEGNRPLGIPGHKW
jgi:hypothetical protein